MKTKIFLFVAMMFSLIVACIAEKQVTNYKNEAERYRANAHGLLVDAEHYRTENEKNAIKVNNLSLELDEYKKYRAEDMATIKTLQTKNRELQNVVTTQTQTIVSFSTHVRDSIIYRDNYIVDTLRCLSAKDNYFGIDGCIDRYGEFTGTIYTIDSLLIVQTIEKARFLGFLWHINKIKNKQTDVVSRSPYTNIRHVETIEIIK